MSSEKDREKSQRARANMLKNLEEGMGAKKQNTDLEK